MCTFLIQITEDRKQKSDDRISNSEVGMGKSEKVEAEKLGRCEGGRRNETIMEFGNFTALNHLLPAFNQVS